METTRVLITEALNDGNRALFKQGKPTYSNLHSLCSVIGEDLDIPSKNVFYRIKEWEKGVKTFRKDSIKVLNKFFEILLLEKENYIISKKN